VKGAKPAKQIAPRAPPEGQPEPPPEEAAVFDRTPASSKCDSNLPADVRLMKPIPIQLRADFGELTSGIARDIIINDTGMAQKLSEY
jgi:hypothetical protein